ncbi:MAG TPA: acyltransferase [Acidimicrobiales bacterium]
MTDDLSTGIPASASGQLSAADGVSAVGDETSVTKGRGFYLRQFDLYRSIAFVGVVAQHSVLWPVAGNAQFGWGSVMILHATRELFFFLSAFVAYYAQATRPRGIGSLWYRRLSQIVVPFLAWTVIYWTYTLIAHAQAMGAWGSFAHDLWWGYYQLYYAVVLIQFYVLLPLLVWLVRVTRRYHWWVLGVSAVLQLAMMVVTHYFSWHTGVAGTIRHYDFNLTTSRVIVGYQLYLILGLLAADHADDVQRFVARWHRAIVAGAAGIGGLTIGYYVIGLALHQAPGHASDLYQPVAVVWFVAAIAGLYALGWIWANRSAGRTVPSRADRLFTWGSDVSGGFYFSHILVLQLVLTGLTAAGLEIATSSWWVTTIVLFPATLLGTAILVTVVRWTPLRFVLTGPDRPDERAGLGWFPPFRRGPSDAGQAGPGQSGQSGQPGQPGRSSVAATASATT